MACLRHLAACVGRAPTASHPAVQRWWSSSERDGEPGLLLLLLLLLLQLSVPPVGAAVRLLMMLLSSNRCSCACGDWGGGCGAHMSTLRPQRHWRLPHWHRLLDVVVVNVMGGKR